MLSRDQLGRTAACCSCRVCGPLLPRNSWRPLPVEQQQKAAS